MQTSTLDSQHPSTSSLIHVFMIHRDEMMRFLPLVFNSLSSVPHCAAPGLVMMALPCCAIHPLNRSLPPSPSALRLLVLGCRRSSSRDRSGLKDGHRDRDDRHHRSSHRSRSKDRERDSGRLVLCPFVVEAFFLPRGRGRGEGGGTAPVFYTRGGVIYLEWGRAALVWGGVFYLLFLFVCRRCWSVGCWWLLCCAARASAPSTPFSPVPGPFKIRCRECRAQRWNGEGDSCIRENGCLSVPGVVGWRVLFGVV